MARILYGIHGTGHGHAMRGLTIARRLRQHEFLFVCADDAVPVLAPEFPIHVVPNLGTVFRNYRVDFRATLARSLKLLAKRETYESEVMDLIHAYAPNVCLTDLEFFVPRAARRCGVPCMTIGHQHVITLCKHHLPGNMWWDTAVQGLTPRYLFRPCEQNLVVSFYQPPTVKTFKTRVVPPILRDKVLAARSEDQGHILVYQSNSTSPRLIEFLKKSTRRTCYVFGHDREEGRDDNVVFMKKSEDGFLELLSKASYVIQGGSHTLMTEALYLGKPVFSIPLKAMVEQRFNALYIERLGYGMQADMERLEPGMLTDFESRLPRYREAIAKGRFCGNDLVFGLVDTFIRTGKLVLDGEPEVLEPETRQGGKSEACGKKGTFLGAPEESLELFAKGEHRV